MLSFNETLSFCTISNYFEPAELDSLRSVFSSKLDKIGRKTFMHSLEATSKEATAFKYEPNGRKTFEIIDCTVLDWLETAFLRNRNKFASIFPATYYVRNWYYVEYSQDQYIKPHIDGAYDELNATSKVFAISIQLNDDFKGGEFSLYTDGSFSSWSSSCREVNKFNYSEEDCLDEWRVKLRQNSAVLFGSRLIHGTQKVQVGVCCKILGFALVK